MMPKRKKECARWKKEESEKMEGKGEKWMWVRGKNKLIEGWKKWKENKREGKKVRFKTKRFHITWKFLIINDFVIDLTPPAPPPAISTQIPLQFNWETYRPIYLFNCRRLALTIFKGNMNESITKCYVVWGHVTS